MFRLKPLEWAIAAVVFLFYGFAVFAVTRDYYVRHPVRSTAAATGAQSGARPAASALEATSAIPEVIRESDPDLLDQRADALLEQSRYDAAIPMYRRILELKPEDVEAKNDLGLALYYAGQTGEALEVLRGGAEARPDFQRIWLTLGFVTLQSGDRPGARKALERARDLGTDNPIGQEAARLLGLAQEEGAQARP